MVLKKQGSFWLVRVVGGELTVLSLSKQFGMIMKRDSVVHNGEIARFFEFAIFEFWNCEEDIVDLPFALLAHRVDKRRIATVDRACLPVRVSFALVAIENLNLILVEEDDSGVAPPLSGTFDPHRLHPSRYEVGSPRSDLSYESNRLRV